MFHANRHIFALTLKFKRQNMYLQCNRVMTSSLQWWCHKKLCCPLNFCRLSHLLRSVFALQLSRSYKTKGKMWQNIRFRMYQDQLSERCISYQSDNILAMVSDSLNAAMDFEHFWFLVKMGHMFLTSFIETMLALNCTNKFAKPMLYTGNDKQMCCCHCSYFCFEEYY